MVCAATTVLACSSKPTKPIGSPTTELTETIEPTENAADHAVAVDAKPIDAGVVVPPDAAPIAVRRSIRNTVLSTRVIGLIPVKDKALKRKWRRAKLGAMLLKLSESEFAEIFVTKTACKDGGDCVRVDLDPCATYGDDECEGFFMTVIVRVEGRRVVLDHMISPTDEPAETLDDIIMYADMAP